MSAPELFHPASVEEARALLAESPMPVDSPTQRRIRTDENLSDYFTRGRRRPDLVWAARQSGDPRPMGVVAAFETADGRMLLDLFGLPADADVARALVARATTEAGPEEALLFAPTDSTADDRSIATVVGPLRDAGWRLLVERRHYEFAATPEVAARSASYPTALRFEQMTDPADPRLVACHREVMRDTLDAHDRAQVDRLGFDRACVESLQFLVNADPVNHIHLAFDERGDVVGMIAGHVWADLRGSVHFVGVARDQRGQGYGRQLLAWQTRRLLGGGATTLSADTDNANVPMARAFADVGWPQTETRLDFVPGN